MQQYAEEALAEHLSKEVQPEFYARAKTFKNPPYSDDLTRKVIDELLKRDPSGRATDII